MQGIVSKMIRVSFHTNLSEIRDSRRLNTFQVHDFNADRQGFWQGGEKASNIQGAFVNKQALAASGQNEWRLPAHRRCLVCQRLE
jgi:hypothetical protein